MTSKHPHSKIVNSVILPDWPTENHIWSWVLDPGRSPNTKQHPQFEKAKKWCHENVRGFWFWSENRGAFFVEEGSMIRNVGWCYSINDVEDAMAFRLAFDKELLISHGKAK